MDQKIFENMLDCIDKNNYQNISSPRINSIILVKNGYIVIEEYYNFFNENTLHRLYSVTKSFTSALVGIAIEEGFIEGLNQPVLDFFPEVITPYLDPRKFNITLEHLLTMTAGLYWTTCLDMMPILVSQSNPYAYVLNLELVHEPGEVFHYSSGVSHLLSGIIYRASGMNLSAFAEEYLFNKIGINEYLWDHDEMNNNFGGSALYLKSRDMARFGYLYLNNGTWEEEQIVTRDWVETSTRTHIDNEGLDYGYQWWIIPELNRTCYTAMGYKGQYIIILTDDNAVLTFTADCMENEFFIHELVSDYIFPLLDSAFETTFSIKIAFLLLLPLIVVTMKQRKNKVKP